ncbi:MAG TPA: thymidylate kinase [Terriglobia bacterium]|nr:thymidylate kinase [Terriglobia bacterium]
MNGSKRFYGKGIPNVDPSGLGGRLIVVEGADGSGRSTQIDLLRDWLERRGFPTVNVGLKRSMLVSEELESAMQGNILGARTLSLFYATDFADQLENVILPALRAGFIVLADRYIYTLMARAIARGVEPEWIQSVYGVALAPDAVFYIEVRPEILLERNLRKHAALDYWESGMDINRSQNMYDSFIQYQKKIQRQFRQMQKVYQFETINGNRAPRAIQQDLQRKIEPILNGKPHETEPIVKTEFQASERIVARVGAPARRG